MALEGRGLYIAQLRYFTTIAKPENVSRAAQLLHLSQSSLSKNLAKLAAEVRTPLFDHSGKRLTLNPAFIRKYFPNGGIRLTECADRTQGLMPPPGTPWASVVWRTCSGMGCDTSTARKALAPGFSSTTCAKGTAWIYGYDREEFTHTSLAAQIAAGTADAGMGFFSAAQLYSPDLLPARMERYDLFIPDSAFDTPMVQRLPGCFTARSFAYQIRVTVLEARDDVCAGISRANEGIVYTGCGTNRGPRKSGCARSWTSPSPGVAL